jgi:hypothetical protein
LVWDIAYALACDRLGAAVTDRLPPGSGLVALLAVPLLLCLALGFGLGQWRADRPFWRRTGVALWCMAVPFVVLVPFFNLMCFVFNSCFGD